MCMCIIYTYICLCMRRIYIYMSGTTTCCMHVYFCIYVLFTQISGNKNGGRSFCPPGRSRRGQDAFLGDATGCRVVDIYDIKFQ